MSVYLASKVPNPNNTPASFLAKDLPGFSPAAISQLNVLGASRFPEVAYALYKSYIDSFLYACFSKKKVYTASEAYGNLYIPDVKIPFSKPPMAFSPSAKLTEDQANVLLKKFEVGATMRSVGRTIEFTIPNAASTDIDKFLSISNPIYTTGPDRLSPLGLKAYYKCLSLIDLFLQANTYPAYKTLEDESPSLRNIAMTLSGVSDEKKKQFFYSYSSDLKRSSSKYQQGNASEMRRLALQTDHFEDAMDVVSNAGDEKELKNLGAMSFDSEAMASPVVTAKPSGKPSSINYGPPGSCPALPGLLFPYFKGLNRPDFVTVKTMLTNRFLRLFGGSFDDCKKELVDIKRGVNSLSNTEAGMEITHVMKGIDLALSTQTRLYLIFESGYLGFALLGGRFGIYDGSQWVEPVEAEVLKEELTKLDTHSTAVNELCGLLSAVKMKDGPVSIVSPDGIKFATDLIRAMQIRDFEGDENIEKIDKTLKRLIWPKPFLQLSPDSFLSFLESLLNKDWALPIEQSVYIPSCKAPIEDKLFLLLSTFGPDSPSLWNTRGDKIAVISRSSRKGKEKTTEDEIPPPNEIIILPKPVLVAYNEWKSILKNGVVSFNFKERAKDYRGHVIKSEEMRKKMWTTLQAVLREAEEIDIGEPAKKKKKQGGEGGTITDAAAVLALF